MREAGVLIGFNNNPLCWHLPDARTGVTLPDSRSLWDVILENKHSIYGYAHTHPGSGRPGYSYEDVTTFSAIERGIGRRLVWWIATPDTLVHYLWHGPEDLGYQGYLDNTQPWLAELLRLSEYKER